MGCNKTRYEEIGKKVERASGLFNACIYNTKQYKHGIITDYCFSGFGTYFRVFYSKDDDGIVFIDDFLKGIIKFVLFYEEEVDSILFGQSKNKAIRIMNEKMERSIKEYFGTDFSEDMIIWVDYEERKNSVKRYEEEKRNDIIYKFYIENLSNIRKYRIMYEAESIIRRNELAYLYMLLLGYDNMLRGKYGESKINKDMPFWEYSRVTFDEKDILKNKGDIDD